jgi:hypothetical protein
LRPGTLRLLVGCVVACFMLLASSCASIEHVSLLRAEQERFSAAATRENLDVRRFLFPGQDDLAKQIEQWDGNGRLIPVSSIETLEAVCQEYGYVKTSLDVLLGDKTRELQQDQLLGIAKALQLFASWRLASCRHMLNALAPRPLPAEANEPPAALTDIAQRAESLVADSEVNVQLGPRDMLLLQLIPGIARYEATTIQVVRDQTYMDKPQATKRQLAVDWVGQIVEADREIERHFSDQSQAASHLMEYYLSTRRVVLLTANNIELRAGLTEGMDGPEGQTYQRVMKGFYARVDNFDEAVKTSRLNDEARAGLTRRLPIEGSSFRSNIP